MIDGANVEDLGERSALSSRAPIAPVRFLWKLYSDLFLYSAETHFRDFSDRCWSKSIGPCAGLRAQARSV